MPFPLIPVIAGLAQLIPVVTGMIAGPKAEENARAIANIATAVTGVDDAQAAVAAIKADPQLLIQMQAQIMQFQTDQYKSETARLEAVNATMRAEYASGDPYQRRWRPTFGYVAAFTWTVQGVVVFGMLAYVVVNEPTRIAETITAIADLMRALAEHWLYALAVLGIAVWKRSDDKKNALQEGAADNSIIGAIASRIRK